MLLAGALLASSALAAGSSLYANRKNRENQDYWNAVNLELANSAHQREVRDLRAAGLNPVLSAGGQGAPSDVTRASATFENPLSGLASGVGSAVSAYQQNKLINSQVKQQGAAADLSVASAKQAEAEAKMQEENLKLLKANNEFNLSPLGRRFYAEKQLLDSTPKDYKHAFMSLFNGADDIHAAREAGTSYNFDEKALKAIREYQTRKHHENIQKNPLYKMRYDPSPWSRMQLR